MHGQSGGVVEIQHRDVTRALPGDDVLLRRDVRVTGAVVVEMVLEHVRHDRDLRAVRERLELKAGKLEHHEVVGR